MNKLTRKDTTALLRVATCSYLLHLGYSCHVELGVNKGGSLRADILAVKNNFDVAICELKSSVADFTSDSKWQSYLEYANRMWFVFTEETFEKLKAKGRLSEIKEQGVGVLVLSSKTGYLSSKSPVTRRHMKCATKKLVLTRMAWRGGISARTNRRQRVFLTEEDKELYAEAARNTKTRRPRRRRTRRRYKPVS